MTETVALVGCGTWGRNILRELRKIGLDVHVVDPSESDRRAALSEGAASVVDSIANLARVNGIIIATPATKHAEVVAAVADRGVPIFVEKPMAVSIDDARRMVESVGERLFVMHIWRYHPGVRSLGAIGRSGELGEVLGLKSARANWRSPRTDVDTVWNMTPHDLSIALEVLGHIPTVRFATAETIAGKAVGLTAVLGNRPWMTLDVSNRYRDKRRELRLHCEYGVAVLPDADSGFIEITRDGDPTVPYDSRTQRLTYDRTPALHIELECFLDYLRGAPPPPTTAAEGLAIVSAVAELRSRAGLTP